VFCYVAAPFHQASFVRIIHEHLIRIGITPTSSWAATARGREDFSRYMPEALRRAWETNMAAVRGSDVVLVYDPGGEGRETYSEAALAREWGKPVAWCSPRGLTRFAPRVHAVDDLDDAIALLVAWKARHAEGYRGEFLAVAA
jgi:hypothetical protein